MSQIPMRFIGISRLINGLRRKCSKFFGTRIMACIRYLYQGSFSLKWSTLLKKAV